jgi:hypothetical protein
MPLHALAYRRDVALQNLHEYFASEDAQAHATTTSTECPLCGTRFSIVLVDKNDSGNPRYIDSLLRVIALGCNLGRHEETYMLPE